jgi:hypothetical protein
MDDFTTVDVQTSQTTIIVRSSGSGPPVLTYLPAQLRVHDGGAAGGRGDRPRLGVAACGESHLHHRVTKRWP